MSSVSTGSPMMGSAEATTVPRLLAGLIAAVDEERYIVL
jgi:hypothetical protein